MIILCVGNGYLADTIGISETALPVTTAMHYGSGSFSMFLVCPPEVFIRENNTRSCTIVTCVLVKPTASSFD